MWPKLVLFSLIVTFEAAAANVFGLTGTFPLSQSNINDPYNITDVRNAITEVLNSLNLTDIEVNIILNRIGNTPAFTTTHGDVESKNFEKSIASLFNTTIATNWHMKHSLQEIATAANNLTVYEILYEILWTTLRSDSDKRNPFVYLELFNDLEIVLKNNTSDNLIKLRADIEAHLVKCSAQVLQSYFIQESTVIQLLKQLKHFDNVYRATIPQVFENLNSIEDSWTIAKQLFDFNSQTQEAVFTHISYIRYIKSRNEFVPHQLFKNLEVLMARPDFINISIIERQTSAKLLPTSMGNLFAVEKICLRNITTAVYLYECPQTYLMCTNFIANNINPINHKKAIFLIERTAENQYTLFSPYWKRYMHLQTTSSINTSSIVKDMNTTITSITKNLYSHVEPTSWVIRFQGDYATIQDSTEDHYVCGGNPSYWSKMEKYAYSRKSMSSYQIQQECLWLLEDCSDDV